MYRAYQQDLEKIRAAPRRRAVQRSIAQAQAVRRSVGLPAGLT